MEDKNITFEDLPKAMSWMMDKLNKLDSKIDGLNNIPQVRPADQWMNLKELCEYLPSHPAEQTVYGWTSCHQIPFHKRGKDIGDEVMLVAICDTFDEMIKGIGYEQKKIHEVIEYLRTVAAYSFDYDMLIKVLSNIAWFPNGSKVITNENEVGIIIKQNKGLADRPIIKIIRDSSGNELKDGPVKNLLECLTVFIVDTTDEEI